MVRFSLKRVSQINGKIRFYYLIIGGINRYTEFENDIKTEGTCIKELDTLQSIMIQVADLKFLPKTKFKDITPKKDPHKEYEVKSKNLRVLLFKEDKGNIIVTGFKKNKGQKNEIKNFRKIKKEYFAKENN